MPPVSAAWDSVIAEALGKRRTTDDVRENAVAATGGRNEIATIMSGIEPDAAIAIGRSDGPSSGN
jgi:hypothetical protein